MSGWVKMQMVAQPTLSFVYDLEDEHDVGPDDIPITTDSKLRIFISKEQVTVWLDGQVLSIRHL